MPFHLHIIKARDNYREVEEKIKLFQRVILLLVSFLVIFSMGYTPNSKETIMGSVERGEGRGRENSSYGANFSALREYIPLIPDVEKFNAFLYSLKTRSTGIQIETEGLDEEAGETLKQIAERNVLHIPEKLRVDFTRHKCKLIIMSQKAYERFWRQEWEMETNSYACYSSTRSRIMTTDVSLKTLAHEFGHHLFTYYGNIVDYEEIYEDDLDSICLLMNSDYGRMSSQEGFAEAYSCYIMNEGLLAEHAPRTYQYIKSLMKSVSDVETEKTHLAGGASYADSA